MRSQIVGISIAIICLFQSFSPAAAGAATLPAAISPTFPITTFQLPIAHYQLPITLSLPAICSSSLQLQDPTACPDLGPGGYASQIVAAGLPYPFPSLSIAPVYPYRGLTPA